MAALVKPAALQNVLRCYREQMLRQQHAETPMSGKSRILILYRFMMQRQVYG